MKRTQLYIDDDLSKILSTVSRQRGVTVSELVRGCIREAFGGNQRTDKAALARQVAGIWKNRSDLVDVEKYVRGLRKDTRRKRLKIG